MPQEFPPEAVCAEEGCEQPVTGIAPSQQDLFLESQDGKTVTRLAAGEYDEGFCTTHLEGTAMAEATETDPVVVEMKEALRSGEAKLALVHTFTHGMGVQIYRKTKKIGPVLLPAEDQTIADVLALVGSMITDA